MKKLEIFMKYEKFEKVDDKISNFMDHKARNYMDNSLADQVDTSLWVDIDINMFQKMLLQIHMPIDQQVRYHVSHL